MLKPKVISIVGFGRFGQLLASILKHDFVVRAHDTLPALATQAKHLGVDFVNLEKVMESEVIFYCVPISNFENVIRDHTQLYKHTIDTKILIDVLSVKTYPRQIFDKYLPANCQVLLTHPMFGPDGVAIKGLSGQTMVMDRFRLSEDNFEFWKTYFAGKELKIIEMPADEHDRMAARSQGVTHLIGRVLHEFGFTPTPIDTLNAQRLFEIETQVVKDSFQLFVDLQTFNPYAEPMRREITVALSKISKELNDVVQQSSLYTDIHGTNKPTSAKTD